MNNSFLVDLGFEFSTFGAIAMRCDKNVQNQSFHNKGEGFQVIEAEKRAVYQDFESNIPICKNFHKILNNRTQILFDQER